MTHTDELLPEPALLIAAEPARVLELLDGARGPRGRFLATVYRASLRVHERMDAARRRQVLALDAARLGDRDLAARLSSARLPDVAPAEWVVDWASGSLIDHRHLRTLTGHDGPVVAVATAVVGGRAVAVTGGRDKALRVWDLSTGRQVHEPLTGRTDPISSCTADVVGVVTAIIDGRTVAVTVDDEGTVLVRDPATGREAGEFLRVVDSLPGVLVTASADLTVHVWDLSTDRLIREFTSVTHLATLDGRRMLVTTEPDGMARLWDATTGHQVGEHLPVIEAVLLEGRPIARTARNGRQPCLWDLATGQPVDDPVYEHLLGRADENALDVTALTVVNGRVAAITLSHETQLVGDLVADFVVDHYNGPSRPGTASVRLEDRPVACVLGADGSLRIWDLAPGDWGLCGCLRCEHSPGPEYRDGMRVLSTVEPNGIPLIPVGGDIRLWDLITDCVLGRPRTGREPGIDTGTPAARAVLDGRDVVLAAEKDHTVRAWELETGLPLGQALTGHTDRVLGVAAVASKRGNLAVTTGLDRRVLVWNLDSGRQEGTPLTGHVGPVWDVATAVVEGRPVAVTAGADHTVRTWDLGHAPVSAAGSPTGPGHTGPILAVATADLLGQEVALTAGADATVRIWDLATGREAAGPLSEPAGAVGALCTARVRGRTAVISTGPDARIHVRDLATGRALRESFPSGHNRVTAMASAELDDRAVLVTAGSDPTPLLWDLAAGEAVGTPLTGHSGRVTGLATTRLDGRPVAVTASWDKTLLLWDLATGRQIGRPLTGHTDWVTSVAAAVVEGRPKVVSRSRDRTLRLWDLRTMRQEDQTDLATAAGCQAVAVVPLNGRPVAVTAQEDHVWLWNPALGGAAESVYALPLPVSALGTAADGRLLVAFGPDVAVVGRAER